ncbi:MAG: RNA polymerase sigma factor [Armatimonadetes bacterium]|nr:RNA polymerase sigma factor [Armatimonadota bacterium]
MKRGSPRNFEELRQEHGDRIFRFCYRLCGHTEDAEDLAQDVLMLAFQGFDRFQGRSSMTTWLYRIALNRWGRVKGARPEGQVPYEEDASLRSTPDPAPAGMERISLERALAELPDALRETFLLVKAEGLKYREAAEILGVPQGTVQSRVHEAATRLRALLSEPSRDTKDTSGTAYGSGCLKECASGEGGSR